MTHRLQTQFNNSHCCSLAYCTYKPHRACLEGLCKFKQLLVHWILSLPLISVELFMAQKNLSCCDHFIFFSALFPRMSWQITRSWSRPTASTSHKTSTRTTWPSSVAPTNSMTQYNCIQWKWMLSVFYVQFLKLFFSFCALDHIYCYSWGKSSVWSHLNK